MPSITYRIGVRKERPTTAMASGAVDFWRLGSVARFQLLLAGVDLKADWHLVCTIRLALAVAFQLRPEKASPLRLEEGPGMKLGMMRGPQGMMFGLQGIAAIYPEEPLQLSE
jgi:hypothetical protein